MMLDAVKGGRAEELLVMKKILAEVCKRKLREKNVLTLCCSSPREINFRALRDHEIPALCSSFLALMPTR